MENTSLVTVIVPSYNSRAFVTAAVDSVLSQSYPNVELIVVDDGSTDDTKQVLENYGDKIRYLFKTNGGVSLARNFGIEQARGEYVAFLDADDSWLPEKLEKQIEAINSSPNAGAAHTSFYLGNQNLEIVGKRKPLRSIRNVLEDLFFVGNVIGTPSSVVAKKSIFEEIGGFDPELSQCADWDMWIKLALKTDFAFVDEPLIIYRQHDGNMSKNARLLETDSTLMFEKAFKLYDLPNEITARRNSVYGKNYTVLAGSYYQAGQYRDFIRCAATAVSLDATQLAYLVSFPMRLIKRRNG